MYVRSVEIEHFRCFAKTDLALHYPGREDGATTLPNVNLLIGNNGGGKTTVLKAIALSILSPILQNSGFRPYYLVRRTRSGPAKEARVRSEIDLHAQDVGSKDRNVVESERLETRLQVVGPSSEWIFTRSETPVGFWTNMVDESTPSFFLVAYSASRLVERPTTFDEGSRRKTRHIRYERVASLFEEGSTLTPFGVWLPSFKTDNPGRYKQVVNLVNRLLPDECRLTEERDETGSYIYGFRGSRVPFPALSDGYRAFIGWIADLLYHITMGAPSGAKLVESKGVVLVDEIDLHLHPEWQRLVVPQLSQTLPNLQFVFTTHSPIVVGTVESRNVFVMEPGRGGASVIRQYRERTHGLSSEQILLSSYFGLETTRADAMEEELTALSHKARDGDAEAAAEYLRKLSSGSAAEENGRGAERPARRTVR